MKDQASVWRVYGGQPMPVAVPTKRAARRLARRYRRLGIRSDIYQSDDIGDWTLRFSVEALGGISQHR